MGGDVLKRFDGCSDRRGIESLKGYDVRFRLRKGRDATKERRDPLVFSSFSLVAYLNSNLHFVIIEDTVWFQNFVLKQSFDLERANHSIPDSTAKRRKSNEYLIDLTAPTAEPSSTRTSPSKLLPQSDIENKVSQTIDSKMGELKKLMSKMYALQKRASGPSKVR